jgi:hypothetical protein
MRKLALLATVVPLLFGSPALAGDEPPERQSVCRVPDVDLSYDTETFTALVVLPVNGCGSREHSQFILSASIARTDSNVGRDMVERSAVCGPFRSTKDFDSDDEAPQYTCNLAVGLDHPETESARYDIEVTFPGAAAERTMRFFSWCNSDGTTASCEE